jgi:hypothetical protein
MHHSALCGYWAARSSRVMTTGSLCANSTETRRMRAPHPPTPPHKGEGRRKGIPHAGRAVRSKTDARRHHLRSGVNADRPLRRRPCQGAHRRSCGRAHPDAGPASASGRACLRNEYTIYSCCSCAIPAILWKRTPRQIFNENKAAKHGPSHKLALCRSGGPRFTQ